MEILGLICLHSTDYVQHTLELEVKYPHCNLTKCSRNGHEQKSCTFNGCKQLASQVISDQLRREALL